MSEANPLEEILIEEAPVGHDFIVGPILKTLVLFSLPTLGTNLLQSFGMTANAIWIGQLLGEDALAATASANMIMFLAFTAVWGFSLATNVKMGQFFGARDVVSARRSFGTGIGFCVGLSLIVAVAGWIFTEEVLTLLSTPVQIRQFAADYLRITFISMPFSTFSMLIAVGLRSVGDAKTPFYAMILTSVIGTALNPFLILGIGPFPELGITGSALTMTLANFIGALAMIAWIYWRDLPLRLRGSEFAFLLTERDELKYVITKGVPMGAMMVITSSATLVMLGLVNREGALTAAAYGAMIQVWNYIQMPAMAVSITVSAMAAQNIGAGRHDRVAQTVAAGLGVSAALTISLFVILIALADIILSLFLGKGSSAIPLAEHIQLVTSWAYIFNGLMMIMVGVLRSYGVVVISLVISALSLYAGRLAFYFLLYPAIGAEALWLSFDFGAAMALVLTWLAYSRGKWRLGFGLPKTASFSLKAVPG
ncbi:MAG: MATE family efflux transporter [Novosphingobium sp.]|nr:MATE family efflux transporter [Novosphingobium sp.]